jgi:hypothetical protein
VATDSEATQNTFLGAFAELQKATVSFVMSVSLFVRLPEWNNSAPAGRILIKSDI